MAQIIDEWEDVTPVASTPITPTPVVDEWEDAPEIDPVIAAKQTLAETTPATTPTVEPEVEQPGMLSRAWKAVSEPLTTLPSQFASQVADYIDKPSIERSPTRAKIEGFVGGAVEGAGDVLSGLTSPIDLATTALTAGTGMAAKRGLTTVAKGLRRGAQAGGALVSGHGATQVLDPESTLAERGFGLAEMAGGAAAMRAPAIDTPPPRPNVTPDIVPKVDAPTPKSSQWADDPQKLINQKKTIAAKTTPKLPGDLQGAKPRFNLGRDSYEPRFESDVDKALFIIAQKNPSKRDADYMKFVLQHTGLDEAGARTAATKLRGEIRLALEGSEPGVVDIPSLYTPKVPPKTVTPKTAPQLAEGTTVIIRSNKATPANVKKAREAGFEFDGLNDQGDFKFKKTSAPTEQPILESEIGQTRPTKAKAQEQILETGDHHLGPLVDLKKQSTTAEAVNLPRALMTSYDLSAPLRQGLPLIHKKGFWKALPDMLKAWGSEDAYKKSMQTIADDPLFKPRRGPLGKELPSFADDAGLKLTELTDLSKREEALMSTWAEKVPGVRPSNRAYTVFLNKLRADTFKELIKSGKVLGVDGEVNIPLARSIADFVNTASGRGSLGKLEKSAVALNSTFFSPRLIASRVKMLNVLNPNHYLYANPVVRKEALKSLLSVTGVGTTLGQLAKLSGMGTVESDPTSSDFGKIKIGNVRVDPFAGFQQYVVLANRLIQGRTKSSTTGESYNLGEKFGRPTRLDVLGRSAESKLHPVLSFATGLLRGKDFTGAPFNVTQEAAQRFVPIMMQDVYELAMEDPKLLPLAIPAAFGMGIQTYRP